MFHCYAALVWTCLSCWLEVGLVVSASTFSFLLSFIIFVIFFFFFFFFSSRRRHTRSKRDWSSDVCSSDLVGRDAPGIGLQPVEVAERDERRRSAADAVEQRHHLRHRSHLHLLRSEPADRRERRHHDEDRPPRSEERRVGKECRSRWAPDEQ